MFHAFYIQHCVGKNWLIEPLIVDLVLTDCTSCIVASLAIQTPTCTWLSTRPPTPTRRVRCMCVVRSIVSNNG
jgi:hypothetical protein